jgi:DNA polymerase-3 subunit delta
MANDAFDALLDMTGFDLRAIDTSLEKLIMYVGDRKTILREDIRNTLVRTKQDPIYTFTNAVSDRNLKDALFYLNTLMSDGPGALRAEQMLVAIHNQIRKLLLVKDFSSSTLGSSWYSACPYNLFQQNVLPLIKAYDRMLLDRLEEWQADLKDRQSAKGAKKSASKRVADALIAPKGASPYPIYLMLKKAERFSRRHLLACIVNLSRADRRIKTGGTDKKLILEELLINICRGPASESDPAAFDSAVAAVPKAL